jgi:hypothetical protein
MYTADSEALFTENSWAWIDLNETFDSCRYLQRQRGWVSLSDELGLALL